MYSLIFHPLLIQSIILSLLLIANIFDPTAASCTASGQLPSFRVVLSSRLDSWLAEVLVDGSHERVAVLIRDLLVGSLLAHGGRFAISARAGNAVTDGGAEV